MVIPPSSPTSCIRSPGSPLALFAGAASAVRPTASASDRGGHAAPPPCGPPAAKFCQGTITRARKRGAFISSVWKVRRQGTGDTGEQDGDQKVDYGQRSASSDFQGFRRAPSPLSC